MNVRRPNPQPQATEQDSKTLERAYRAAVSTVYALDVRLSVATALLRDVKARTALPTELERRIAEFFRGDA